MTVVDKPTIADGKTIADTQAIAASSSSAKPTKDAVSESRKPDRFLSPLSLEPVNGRLGPVLNKEGLRCSDKGFLSMSLGDYLDLVEWTGRQIVRGKKGRIPNTIGPILARLKLDRHTWCDLVGNFGKRFFHVAGEPKTIDATSSRIGQHRYYVPAATRTLYSEIKLRPSAPA